MEYLREIVMWDQKEGLAFATASFNDFSSKVTERQKQV
jgi:hypothetical protein